MILVCGEALFDVFLAEEDAHGRIALDATPGGSPFNVAVGLSRLGRSVGYFGGLSRDLFGERLASILTREGVDMSLAPRKDAPTTLAFVELSADRSARYSFRGADAADRAIEVKDLPAPDQHVRALTFGSYSTIVEPAGDALLSFAQREASRRVVFYDPNVRPTVEPDLDVWRVRFKAFADAASVVKLSEEDLELIAPARPIDECAADLLGRGVGLVVLTRAERGVVAFGRFGRIEQPPRSAKIIDTVGAGDTVSASILTWLDEADRLSRKAIEELEADETGAMLDFAMRAAAITCGRRGAELPRRIEIA
ncbi:MAG: carbohydrate kinase [Beijerinckiaceae bacterium]